MIIFVVIQPLFVNEKGLFLCVWISHTIHAFTVCARVAVSPPLPPPILIGGDAKIDTIIAKDQLILYSVSCEHIFIYALKNKYN